MHILIVGSVGIGKSTLIRRILERVEAPVFGFRTIKAEVDGSGNASVYIYPATGDTAYMEKNAVGLSSPKGAAAYTGAFDRFGVAYLSGIPAGAAVLMDELGFLESKAEAFCGSVMRILEGPYYVIAAVKPANTPFLEAVRANRDALTYTINEGNRNDLYGRILLDLQRLDPGSPFLAGNGS